MFKTLSMVMLCVAMVGCHTTQKQADTRGIQIYANLLVVNQSFLDEYAEELGYASLVPDTLVQLGRIPAGLLIRSTAAGHGHEFYAPNIEFPNGEYGVAPIPLTWWHGTGAIVCPGVPYWALVINATAAARDDGEIDLAMLFEASEVTVQTQLKYLYLFSPMMPRRLHDIPPGVHDNPLRIRGRFKEGVSTAVLLSPDIVKKIRADRFLEKGQRCVLMIRPRVVDLTSAQESKADGK